MCKVALFSAVLCAVSFYAQAITQDEKIEIKTAGLPIFSDCAKEHGTTLADLKALHDAGKLSEIDGCLLACVAKKLGVITDAGEYDPTKAIAHIQKFLHDPSDIAKATEVANDCASVNSEAVTDGAKGCERAKLLGACLRKHKDEVILSL